MNKKQDIDCEWQMERATFGGRLEALSVSMQLFCEQNLDVIEPKFWWEKEERQKAP